MTEPGEISMVLRWASLAIFVCGFASFLFFEKYRHWLAAATAGLAALVVIGVGVARSSDVFFFVNWKIITIFFATLVAAEVFMLSGAAAVAAEAILAKLRRPSWAILALCALTGFLSIFVENVACVLIAAPVALSLAERLKMPPQPILIGCALASNLQGCALLVGDPPSMLLAAEANFTFFDFIWLAGRPSIFWCVQAGAVAGLAFLWLVFRKYKGRVELERTARLLGVLPSVCLVGVIAALAVGTQIEHGIGWGAAVGCAVFAAISVIWYWRAAAREGIEDETVEEALVEHKLPLMKSFIRGLDWKTTIFLICIFVPVTVLEKGDWIKSLAGGIESVAGESQFAVFAILVMTAMIASAFVDNVPFLLVMLPAVKTLAPGLGIEGSPILLYFGLLLGASVGGNITPVGAQANIAAMGFLRKHGQPFALRKYMALSVPYTLAAISAACLCTYLLFGGA